MVYLDHVELQDAFQTVGVRVVNGEGDRVGGALTYPEELHNEDDEEADQVRNLEDVPEGEAVCGCLITNRGNSWAEYGPNVCLITDLEWETPETEYSPLCVCVWGSLLENW